MKHAQTMRKIIETPSNQRLRAQLKEWCKEHGLSQSSLAMKVGVSSSHLNQIINGRARPSPALLRRLLDVLSSEGRSNGILSQQGR